MNSTDFLDIRKHKIINNVKENLPGNITKSLNVLAVKNGVLYTWDFQSQCILTLNIKSAREKDSIFCQKLLPIAPPIFSPEKIQVNDNETLLLVSGPKGVIVFELPSRCPPHGYFSNNKELVYCRTYNLEERLLLCKNIVELLQVKFHPGSVRNNHVLLLTSDNILRLYQIEDEVVNLGVYPVGEIPVGQVPGSKISFLGALGEIAIDFDFGMPYINENIKTKSSPNRKKSSNNSTIIQHSFQNHSETVIQVQHKQKNDMKSDREKEEDCYLKYNWPVYILTGDFIVSTINIPLNGRGECKISAPLHMISSGILQNDQRACSIICLNSTPEILCIGSTVGEILHGLLLPVPEDKEDTSITFTRNDVDQEIHLFEVIDIDLGLVTTDLKEGYSCPIFLHKDEARCDRYFATHSAGVHVISIGCMSSLQYSSDSECLDIFSSQSSPEYLVCTKTTTTKAFNPVIGFAVYNSPNAIITLLASGQFLSLPLLTSSILPKFDKLMIDDDLSSDSITEIKKLPFDQYIQHLLKSAETHPILQLPKSENCSLKECQELLKNASKIFHEKCKYNSAARDEIVKRLELIRRTKKYLLEELVEINKEKQILQEKAESLAEKYEDTKEKQDNLSKRCAKMLVLLAMKKEKLSESEINYLEQLQNTRKKLKNYETVIEKIISKKSYQESQMRFVKMQQEEKNSMLSDKYMNTVKDSISNSSIKINDMIEVIDSVKKKLHLN